MIGRVTGQICAKCVIPSVSLTVMIVRVRRRSSGTKVSSTHDVTSPNALRHFDMVHRRGGCFVESDLRRSEDIHPAFRPASYSKQRRMRVVSIALILRHTYLAQAEWAIYSQLAWEIGRTF
jgi:hypothetical protein